MLSLEILYEKLPFMVFVLFLWTVFQGIMRLKRFLRLPLLLFAFILVGIPFIKDLVWLFGVMEMSVLGYYLAKRLPRTYPK